MRLGVTFLAVLVSLISTVDAVFMESPDGKLKAQFELNSNGRPTYRLFFDPGEEIIKESGLGFDLIHEDPNVANLKTGFVYEKDSNNADKVTYSTFDETWKPIWGEEDEIRNHYNEMLVELVQDNTLRRQMNIRFRLFNDGLGFRYEFPQNENLVYFAVEEERTQFAMTGDHTAYWIAGDYDTQEWNYQITKLSEIRARHPDSTEPNVCHTLFSETGVQTALQLKTDNGLYINLHEAALYNYSAMHLELDDNNMIFESHLTPGPEDIKAYIQAPFNTPWRTIIASYDARDILASRITYNLNEPTVAEDNDWDWVKPIKYVGVWWEMITGAKAWDYTNDLPSVQLHVTDYSNTSPHGNHGATTEHVKRYIDFAAEHGFDAVLVEGWNIGWEDWFGNFKDYVFDFLTPYPDFDLKHISDYSKEKGVVMMMHHETSAATRNYERHLHRAYKMMREYNYGSIKSGYVGCMYPRGQHHYSQDMVNHYQYAVQEAVPYKIAINAHEAVRPTGLGRTWPNLIANEAARGQEYQAFDNGNHPHHVTILPFTRQIGGPMDYTPGVFNMDLHTWAGPDNQGKVNSTIANQLGLYVTMYSPLQMAADTIENYEPHLTRGFRFIKDVPVAWKKSVYLEAEPGKYVTIARKDLHSDNWFVGSVANEDGHQSSISLDFLDAGFEYTAEIFSDDPAAHYWTNPHVYEIKSQTVTSTTNLLLTSAPGGGFAISLKRLG